MSETIETLREKLKALAVAEGGPMFMGWPDRWWERYLRRCTNNHVSSMTLKSESLGRDACLVCQGPVTMTFPEDIDGPLTVDSSMNKIKPDPNEGLPTSLEEPYWWVAWVIVVVLLIGLGIYLIF